MTDEYVVFEVAVSDSLIYLKIYLENVPVNKTGIFEK